MKKYRCASRIQFIISGDIVEVKCKSKHCGAKSGVVVLHRFSIKSGELVETLKFQDPAVFIEKGKTSATEHDSAAVRSA